LTVFPLLVALALQADGFNMNVTTLAVVTALAGTLTGAVTFLFRAYTASQREQNKFLQQQNEDLAEERDLLLDKLFDMTRTADRNTDLADDAAQLLLKRRRGTRREEPPRESRR
jgi:hypothetical protein